jgi:hypothetical protein
MRLSHRAGRDAPSTLGFAFDQLSHLSETFDVGYLKPSTPWPRHTDNARTKICLVARSKPIGIKAVRVASAW